MSYFDKVHYKNDMNDVICGPNECTRYSS